MLILAGLPVRLRPRPGRVDFLESRARSSASSAEQVVQSRGECWLGRTREGDVVDRRHHERWVLAFDASCGTCRQISGVAGEACDGKLEVLPLADANVRQWREQSLGVDAEWAPTL